MWQDQCQKDVLQHLWKLGVGKEVSRTLWLTMDCAPYFAGLLLALPRQFFLNFANFIFCPYHVNWQMFLLLLITLVSSVHSLDRVLPPKTSNSKSIMQTRANFITSTAAVLLFPTTALAAKPPPYEACMSLCIYECTKPKGGEQKLRTECIGECKIVCKDKKRTL